MELSRHTTLGLGGPARATVEPDSQEALIEALTRTDGPQLILGGGSNLVVADAGFAGTVIQLGPRFARVSVERSEEAALLVAEAGASFDALVERTVGEGLRGLEVLSGIPGSIGATPIQNVGAYGRDVAELMQWVEVYDREEARVLRMPAAACGFGYRTSRFKHQTRFVVLRVALRLEASSDGLPIAYVELARALGVREGAVAPLSRVREAVLTLRRSKGMVLDSADPDSRSAGSFFTNPIVSIEQADHIEAKVARAGFVGSMPRYGAAARVKLSAAWLLERAGFHRGFGAGPIGVSSKHTLALVNRGGGTTEQLLTLARALRDGVRARYGVTLEPEPVFVGCQL